MILCHRLLLSLLLHSCVSVVHSVDPWSYIVVADWHGAETFVNNPVKDESGQIRNRAANDKVKAFKHIKQEYGGDLVIFPGDTNSGKWYKEEFLDILNVETAEEAVRKAGERCYQGLKYVFEKAGYSTLLIAVGDHEIGGNPWDIGDLKTNLLPLFRRVFFREFNRAPNGEFLYNDPIGNALSRPKGTTFQDTSYAYRYKNALFVTVDAFRQLPYNFKDPAEGLGGEGSVTCDVSGEHLAWFKRVLQEARKDPTIKHIFVQAHLPILQPVRKVRCTGQFMDRAENSEFFQAMRDYQVDVYFAGEVHTNTATKDDESNLVQVVSRGNGAENFIKVEVSDSSITIRQFNEVGTRPRYNLNYEPYGIVTIDKSGEETTFKSSGSLKIIDRKKPMVHLSFDEMTTLAERPVLALTHDDYQRTLVQRKMTITGVECWNSFPNLGEFGQQFDAQVGNVALRPGKLGSAAKLNSTSRVAIFGMGPHSAGLKVSYALWCKTSVRKRKQILVHFGDKFGITRHAKNPIFTLTMDEGRPALYAESNMVLVPRDEDMDLANNEWHHVVITMPSNSCRLSEVKMYVDGQTVPTRVEGDDDHLFFTTSGMMSIGGLGHSHKNLRKRSFPKHVPFEGLVDEVYVWADSLSLQQVKLLSQGTSPGVGAPSLQTAQPTNAPQPSPKKATFTVHLNYQCASNERAEELELIPEQCQDQCLEDVSCLGYHVLLSRAYLSPRYRGRPFYTCRHFFDPKPERGEYEEGFVCGIKS